MATGKIPLNTLASINFGPNDYSDTNWVEQVVVNGQTAWTELSPVTRKENIAYWNTFDVRHPDTNALSSGGTMNIGTFEGLWKDIKRNHYWNSNLGGGCFNIADFNESPALVDYPGTNYSWGTDVTDTDNLECSGGWSSNLGWSQLNSYGWLQLTDIPRDETMPTIGTNYSISVWVKFTRSDTSPYFRFEHNGGENTEGGSASTNYFKIQRYSSKPVVYVGHGDPSTGVTSADVSGAYIGGNIEINEWENFVISVSGTSAKVYRNGSAYTDATGNTFTLNRTSTTNVSDVDRWFLTFFDGGIRIDDWRIYNIALSAKEAAHIASRRTQLGDYVGGGSFLRTDETIETEERNEKQNQGMTYDQQLSCYTHMEKMKTREIQFNKEMKEHELLSIKEPAIPTHSNIVLNKQINENSTELMDEQ